MSRTPCLPEWQWQKTFPSCVPWWAGVFSSGNCRNPRCIINKINYAIALLTIFNADAARACVISFTVLIFSVCTHSVFSWQHKMKRGTIFNYNYIYIVNKKSYQKNVLISGREYTGWFLGRGKSAEKLPGDCLFLFCGEKRNFNSHKTADKRPASRFVRGAKNGRVCYNEAKRKPAQGTGSGFFAARRLFFGGWYGIYRVWRGI